MHGKGRYHHHISRELPHRAFYDGCENIPERSVIAGIYLVAGALPSPLRTLLVPFLPGLQWLTHSSEPLGQASTAEYLHSKEIFPGGFPRLLILLYVLSQSTAQGAPSYPQTLVTLGARPSEDKHVCLRGFASRSQSLAT